MVLYDADDDDIKQTPQHHWYSKYDQMKLGSRNRVTDYIESRNKCTRELLKEPH